MPRPGPRPYECVRRSWHSDRHQPIRGSIIQQIFRVVQENHSPVTKKNREWQEKLPLVVFKSEEIMYSKANSEAEYVDPETLWDRINDAINTIIRKDETMETGEFLPPCVEAALNLGCVPVRSSRSQRNSNTRSYLGPRNQDSGSTPPKLMDTASNVRNPNLPNVAKPKTPIFSDANRDVSHNYQNAPLYPQSFENFPKQIESRASLGASSVYPLYYGVNFQPQAPQLGVNSTHQKSNTIIVGTPVFQAVHEPLPETLFLLDRDDNNIKKTTQEESQSASIECDLSLRLGVGSSKGKSLTFFDNVDLGQSNYQSSPQNKEFSFFPLNSEGEQVQNLVADDRKRKAAPVNHGDVEGGQYFLHLDPNFNMIDERMKRRGL